MCFERRKSFEHAQSLLDCTPDNDDVVVVAVLVDCCPSLVLRRQYSVRVFRLFCKCLWLHSNNVWKFLRTCCTDWLIRSFKWTVTGMFMILFCKLIFVFDLSGPSANPICSTWWSQERVDTWLDDKKLILHGMSYK